MRPCSRIYYSYVSKLLNRDRATNCSSSRAQKLKLQPLVLHTFVVASSCRQPQTYVKPEVATTAFELLIMSGVSLETC